MANIFSTILDRVKHYLAIFFLPRVFSDQIEQYDLKGDPKLPRQVCNVNNVKSVENFYPQRPALPGVRERTTLLTMGSPANVTDHMEYSLDWYDGSCLFVGTIGFASNALVTVALIKQCRRKVHTKLYSLSLALGNMLYAMVAMCQFLSNMMKGRLGLIGCRGFAFFVYMSYYVSMDALLMLAAERFCAVKFPVRFKKWTTSRNVRAHVTASWLVGTALAAYPVTAYQLDVIEENSTITYKCRFSTFRALVVYELFFDMLLPVSLFIGLTACAICALKKRSVVSVTGENSRAAGTGRSLKKTWLHLIFIVIMFCLCFGIYAILGLTKVVAPEVDKVPWMYILNELVHVITVLHTWFNPIMHWICDERFRKDVLFMCCKQKASTDLSRETNIQTPVR